MVLMEWTDPLTQRSHDGSEYIHHYMREGGSTMKVTTLGIDLAKSIFQLHAVDEHGQVATRKRVPQSKLLETVAQLPSCVIGREA